MEPCSEIMTERHSRIPEPADDDTNPLQRDQTQRLTPRQTGSVPQQPVPPPSATKLPPASFRGTPDRRQQPAQAYPAAALRRARRPAARESGLYLPWWSLLIMLVTVFALAFGLVLLVYTLGNRVPNTQREPVIRIITAEPSQLAQPGAVPPVALSEPQTILGNEAPGSLALEGPTLAPIIFTATPAPVSVGATIVVQGVGAQQLNIRDVPGVIGTNVVFRADEGTRFIILDGPSQADGFTWWRIQNTGNASQTGWAVANYLSVVAAGE